jgi:ubiquinone biosynthesis protein UbiJ
MVQHMLLQFLNRILSHDEGTRTTLAAHAGKRLRFVTAPLSVDMELNARGYFVAAPAQEPAPKPDLTVSFPLSALPLALRGKHALTQEARIEGNVALANALNALFDNAPRALESETERWVGPVVAHNLAQAGKGLAESASRLRESVERNTASVLKRSDGPLPTPDAVSAWRNELYVLSNRVDALAQRVERLTR